jgi:hypothetical protein
MCVECKQNPIFENLFFHLTYLTLYLNLLNILQIELLDSSRRQSLFPDLKCYLLFLLKRETIFRGKM